MKLSTQVVVVIVVVVVAVMVVVVVVVIVDVTHSMPQREGHLLRTIPEYDGSEQCSFLKID